MLPNRKLISYPYVLVMLVVVLSVAGLLSNLGLANSHSAGLLVSFFPILLLSFIGGHWSPLRKSELHIVLCFLLAVLVHFFTVALIAGPVDYVINGSSSRFFSSFILLCLLLWCAFQIECYLALLTQRNFIRLINTVYRCLVILAAFSLPFHWLDLVSRKQMLIFSEPSHFALVFGPFYLYKIFTSSYRHTHFLICLSLALMLENVTLIVFALFGFLLSLKRYGFMFLLVALLVFSIGFAVTNYFEEYTNFLTSRLYFGEQMQTENLSLLALLSGYERAYLTVTDWSYIGVGFQQMGIVGPLGEIQSNIQLLTKDGGTMNTLDGGTLFSKITVEFGIFGVLGALVYLQKYWMILKRLTKLDENSPLELFYTLCFLGFFIILFMRSVNYFSPSFFIFIVALIGLRRVRRNLNLRRQT